MPMRRLIRPVLVLGGLLGLGACVAPPPGPLPAGQVVLGSNCAAGFYQCALPAPQQVGTACACSGLGAPSYGTVR